MPVAAAGGIAALHGTIASAHGAYSLMTQQGRLDETGNKKPYSKKEARELGRQKRESQPASEEKAKWKARELEKSKGKDARRAAHDMKEKGSGDRSNKQLDEDYNPQNH